MTAEEDMHMKKGTIAESSEFCHARHCTGPCIENSGEYIADRTVVKTSTSQWTGKLSKRVLGNIDSLGS